MGVIVKVHCFSVVFCCLHTLLTSYIIFVSRTMMHVVKILRLLAAVSTFKIALFFCCSYSASSYMVENQIWFGTRREAKISFSSTRHTCFPLLDSTYPQETLFEDFVLRTTPLPTTNSLIPLLSSHTKCNTRLINTQDRRATNQQLIS
ncbi:hypothetical protein YC2023_083047 [Brassica napus]